MAYNYRANYVPSSDEFTKIKRERNKQQVFDSMKNAAVYGAGIFGTHKLIQTDLGQRTARRMFKGNMLNQMYKFDNGLWNDIRIKKKITLGDMVLNATKTVEEISPFKILRTFHTSSWLFPIVTADRVQTTLSKELIALDKNYYKTLLNKYGNNLSAEAVESALEGGFSFENGKLLNFRTRQTLIDNARLVHLSPDVQGLTNPDGTPKTAGSFNNRIYEKFRNVIGMSDNVGFDRTMASDLNKIGIIAGKSTKQMYGNWSRAYLRLGMEPAYKLVNKPLEFLSEYIDHIGHTVSPNWKSISERLSLNIVPERFTGSTRQAIKQIALQGAKRTVVTRVGYEIANAVVTSLAPTESPFNMGIYEGLVSKAASMHVGFAELWSDKFQEIKEKQEEIAPGSTKLTTLIGFPLAGAMAGGTYGYMKRAGTMVMAPAKIGETLANYHAESSVNLIKKLGFKIQASPVKKYTFLGALAASMAAIPFLPGAMVGKSSEELRSEYSGSKEVAVRTNRWWASGSYEYEGGKIKYFRPSLYSAMMRNATDETIYGNRATENRLNPILHPIDYLQNPYQLEQLNASKTPYPVWGMDVSYGAFFGKMFEKTAGALIKPDVINPMIAATKKEYQSRIEKNLAYTTNYEGFDIDSRINNFKQANMSGEGDRSKLAQRIKEAEAKSSALMGQLNEDTVGGTAPMMEGTRNKYMSMVDLDTYDIVVDDGDTVVLRDRSNREKREIEIRLSGLDTPEVATHKNDPIDFLRFDQEQEYGQEAAQKLKQLIAAQGSLKLAINREEMSYGRYVGVLIGDNNTNINLEMVRQGATTALPWGQNDLITKGALMQAQEEAKTQELGLWKSKRYKAVDLFNQMTGYTQTYNTLTRIDKLAARPELAAYVSYLNSLNGQQGDLSQNQVQELQRLASLYNKSSAENKQMNGLLKRVGIAVSHDQAIQGSGGFLKGAVTNAMASIGDGLEINGSGQSFTVKQNVTSKDKRLIDANMMHAPESPTYNPARESSKFIYNSATEFAGLKGWIASMLLDEVGFDYKDTPTELARSGESTNIARFISDWNLGGGVGSTEAQRRAIPTSKDLLYERVNPMQNEMPGWLPSKADDFYIDFRVGNPYQKIENGYYRLPGEGYETFHPELKGLKPEDYPDIHKFKILSSVAVGSNQFYRMKDEMDRRYEEGILTDYEKQIYLQTKEQIQEQSIIKRFDEYKTGKDKFGYSAYDNLRSSFWQTVTHNAELPTESLTFFRPAGKFIHKRTATEDYIATQIMGSDLAMWTKPYEHMIKPAINKSIALLDSEFMPEETQEKRNINEYFEALEYVKQRRLYKQAVAAGDQDSAYTAKNSYLGNVYGAATLNLDTDVDLTKSYIAFDSNTRPYYASFASEQRGTERSKILALLPDAQAELMSKIWHRRDDIAFAQANGSDVGEAVRESILEDEAELRRNNSALYGKYKSSGEEEHSSFAEYVADQKAEAVIKKRTGMPSDKFVGWDPRIDINDIKIKTLMIGKEDVREFGFWQQDEDRISRMFVLNNANLPDIDTIKSSMHNNSFTKQAIRSKLYHAGISVSDIKTTPSFKDEVDIFIE